VRSATPSNARVIRSVDALSMRGGYAILHRRDPRDPRHRRV